MSDLLSVLRSQCGMAGEEAADRIEALEAALAQSDASPQEAQPFAFVQEFAGYQPRLFLASEVPDMMTRDWVDGVTVRPLYLGAASPQEDLTKP